MVYPVALSFAASRRHSSSESRIMMASALAYTLLDSPLGALTLAATDRGLRQLGFGNQLPAAARLAPKHPVLVQAAAQLEDYFAGTRTMFGLPLDPKGTSFQQQVWALLEAIPYGETTTYGALARQLGDPGKARAVGLANARNPLAIVVPCHRVVGTSGALTGFAGGLGAKAFLLRLERRIRPTSEAGQIDLFAGA